MQLAYLTDVEGQWEKLETFCADNPLVWFDAGCLTVAEGATFVFGGDAIDRGPHSRRIVSVLSEAKRRYPEQVVLLAGNRDINKLRLGRELSGHPPSNLPQHVAHADAAGVLRWIFERTMGAPDAFEHRRTELGSSSGAEVGAEQVVQSFIEDVAPDGALTQYLALCELAYRQGHTLFVHGGLGTGSLGVVPSQDGFQSVSELDDWMTQLNAWYRSQLAAYRAGALETSGEPAWQPLIAYQAPAAGQRTNPHSVVYARLGDEHNDPRLPATEVVERLRTAGIRRLVVGHMPAGDTPSLLRDPSRGFELVFADNSHSRVTRGSRVLLRDDAVSIEGEVVLDDATRHPIRFSLGLDERSPVGSRIGSDGPLIKAPLGADAHLTFKALAHYRLEQRSIPNGQWRAEELSAPYP